MGIGGISVWQLLIILAIVIMLFGTKRLRTLGGDLGSAVKGFRKSMQDDGAAGADTAKEEAPANDSSDPEKDK
ncbi:MAG: sec-independent protein translocase protein TatA [Halieaceae bacterium]|jgi:sec-independent protein translocase protein TatA